MDEQSSEQQVPVVDGQAAYENLRDARAEIEDVGASLRQALAADDELAAADPADDDDSRESR